MMKITCTGCQKVLPVAEEHAGKWIRCRGCGTAVQAVTGEPDHEAAGPSEVDGGPAVRRMDKREYKQRTAVKGDSSAGGSGMHLDGPGFTGFGNAAGESAAGAGGSFAGLDLSGPATPDSQSQLWELKELNRQKAEGEVTKAQYRERKAEIMAGRTLAVQAMSRSADGMAPRTKKPRGRRMPVLPGPVRALVVAAAVGIAGLMLWDTVLTPDPEVADGGLGKVAVAEVPANADAPGVPAVEPTGSAGAGAVVPPTSEPPGASPDKSQEEPGDGGVDPVQIAGVPGGAGGTTVAGVDDPSLAQEGETAGDVPPVLADPDEGSDPDERLAAPDLNDDNTSALPPEALAPARAEPVEWTVPWPDAFADEATAVGRACPITKQMELGDDDATIGVAGGPEATDRDDPAYAAYRAEMHAILTNLASEQGVYNDLVIKTSDQPKRMGSLVCDRYYVEHRYRRGLVAMILTGVQDGYCVSYWFSGSKRIVPKFFELVGSATFERVEPD